METETSSSEPKKLCPHCQKEISVKAKKCPHCQTDLRSWFARHPIITVILVLIVVSISLNTANNTRQTPSQYATPSDTASQPSAPTSDSLMAQNNPTIKQLSTLPTNYIGKTFTLYVNAEDARYYNYGFSDETAWYSLQIWDSSVGGDFEGVYAYVPKTAANQDLINKALNGQVFLKITASIPSSKWQDNSNAFLQIDSWSYQQ